MDTDAMEQLPQPVQRPTFLTVLCILTFIGSGWSVLSNLQNYRHAGLSSEVVSTTLDSAQSQIQREAADNPGVDMVDKLLSGARELADPFKIQKLALWGLLSSVLTLAGGFFMFQQRKTGFWIYLAGTGIAAASPFIVFGSSSFISIAMASGSGFVGIIFCVLYSLNIKHMR